MSRGPVRKSPFSLPNLSLMTKSSPASWLQQYPPRWIQDVWVKQFLGVGFGCRVGGVVRSQKCGLGFCGLGLVGFRRGIDWV